MNKRFRGWLFFSPAILLIIVGCNLGSAVAPTTTEAVPDATAPTSTLPPATVKPTDTPVPATQTLESQSTPADPSPTLVPTDTPQGSTATSGPICIVIQDLNLRPGPGTAYRPPIIALPANTELVPLGYNPTGIPGGSWLQVKDKSLNQIGWVSAGAQFVSCNIDLTSLPPVAVAPPPPPEPPQTNNSTPDGTFPPNFVWEADFNSQYFIRFRVYDTTSGGTKDGDGISQVSFQVLDKDGKTVYERVERASGFCIFMGGEPECNPWVLEDFIYKWTPGGEPVREGDYLLLIVVTAKSGEQGNWDYEVNIDLP